MRVRALFLALALLVPTPLLAQERVEEHVLYMAPTAMMTQPEGEDAKIVLSLTLGSMIELTPRIQLSTEAGVLGHKYARVHLRFVLVRETKPRR